MDLDHSNNTVSHNFMLGTRSEPAEIRHPVLNQGITFGGFVYIRNKKCVWHRNLWMDGAESRRWHSRRRHYRVTNNKNQPLERIDNTFRKTNEVKEINSCTLTVRKTILHNFNLRPIHSKRILNEVVTDFYTFLHV